MMRLSNAAVMATVLGVMLTTGVSYGQRGMGDSDGVARQAVRPEIVSIAGTVREVISEPCQWTTGRFPVGTHVLVDVGEDEINVHLGPSGVVSTIAERLEVGMPISVEGFRTPKMPANHLVAQRLIVADEDPIVLRDAQLRPFWAAGAGWLDDSTPGSGRGAGMGRGPGWGRGAGMGRGPGWGRGAGGGRGRGPARW